MSHSKVLSLVASFLAASMLFVAFFISFSWRVPPTIASDHILRVDTNLATGSEDGSDWDNAFHNLQDALATAEAGDEIWVAQGVYYPDVGSGITDNDLTASFSLTDDLAIYGGFAATETVRSERDWENNLTVLSGDVEGNDTAPTGVVTATSQISGSNSYHVVSSDGVTDTAVLDGFTVTAGYAYSTSPNNSGGGMLNSHNSSPSLTNVTFSGNAASSSGGGMFNDDNSSPNLINVIFSGNFASFGGGMSNSNGSSPTLTNTTFSGNSAVFGGGMSNSVSNPTLTNTTFSSNSADFGGGIFNSSTSNPSLTNVTFSDNSAVLGGGIRNEANSNPSLVNVALSGNSATFAGGGVSNFGSSPSLINVTVSGNSASSTGGGIDNTDNSSPSLVNTIIWNNSASGVTDTISASISNDSSTPTLSNSIIQNSGGSSSWESAMGTDGGNNLDRDPQFVTMVDPATAPTMAGNLRLQTSSPAIHTGNTLSYTNATSSTTDLDGNIRIFDSVIDRGAYESQIARDTVHLPLIVAP